MSTGQQELSTGLIYWCIIEQTSDINSSVAYICSEYPMKASDLSQPSIAIEETAVFCRRLSLEVPPLDVHNFLCDLLVCHSLRV